MQRGGTLPEVLLLIDILHDGTASYWVKPFHRYNYLLVAGLYRVSAPTVPGPQVTLVTVRADCLTEVNFGDVCA